VTCRCDHRRLQPAGAGEYPLPDDDLFAPYRRRRGLPLGNPHKITISLDPELAEELDLYATAYAAEYQSQAEMDALLVPIIRAFLERDRLLQKWKRQQQRHSAPTRKTPRTPVISASNPPLAADASAPTME
jgi:hypothetical protein